MQLGRHALIIFINAVGSQSGIQRNRIVTNRVRMVGAQKEIINKMLQTIWSNRQVQVTLNSTEANRNIT